MRRLKSLGLFAAAFGAVLALKDAAFAGDIFGVWATQKNNGRVRIEACGQAVCGRVIDGNQLRSNPDQTDVNNPDPAKRTRRVKGLMILEGYSGGPPQWQGGSVYDPQTGDETRNSTLTLVAPDTLRVEGCRLVFCRLETWTRAH
jgi:uncharacterized protein (DUF2147 family)